MQIKQKLRKDTTMRLKKIQKEMLICQQKCEALALKKGK